MEFNKRSNNNYSIKLDDSFIKSTEKELFCEFNISDISTITIEMMTLNKLKLLISSMFIKRYGIKNGDIITINFIAYERAEKIILSKDMTSLKGILIG